MRSKLRTIFLKQDLCSRSVLVSLALAGLIGVIVILCDGYSGDYLGPTAIVASYSFIADIVFAYLAVSSLGKDFHNRTINMIRVSPLGGCEVLVRKLLVFMVTALVTGGLLVAELAFYRYVVQHVSFDFWAYARSILIDYIAYGAFLFTLASLLVLLLKNTLTAFLATYFGITAMTFLTLYLSQLGGLMDSLMANMPFSFMRAVFTGGASFFNLHELLVLVIWTLAALLLTVLTYRKRGFV